MSPDFLIQLNLNRLYRPVSLFLQQYRGKRDIFSRVTLTLQIKHPLAWWLGKLSEAVVLDDHHRSLPTEIFYPILTFFPFLMSPPCSFQVWGSDFIVLLCSSVLSILYQNYFNKNLKPRLPGTKGSDKHSSFKLFFLTFQFLGGSLILFSYPLISMRSCFSLCFTIHPFC